MNSETTKTAGRVVRLLTKHSGAEASVEQWFLIGIDSDEKALAALSRGPQRADEIIEIVGEITPAAAAQWKLREGEVRLVLPGEAIGSREAD